MEFLEKYSLEERAIIVILYLNNNPQLLIEKYYVILLRSCKTIIRNAGPEWISMLRENGRKEYTYKRKDGTLLRYNNKMELITDKQAWGCFMGASNKNWINGKNMKGGKKN